MQDVSRKDANTPLRRGFLMPPGLIGAVGSAILEGEVVPAFALHWLETASCNADNLKEASLRWNRTDLCTTETARGCGRCL